MYCRNCGTDVTNMKYCPKCGTCVDSSESGSPPVENTQSLKVLTISQLKWFSFSVVLVAWGLLFIAGNLVPYIMAEIRYNFSDYELFTYICTAVYLVLSLIVVLMFQKAVKVSGYMETSQYKFSKTLALNKSNFIQIVLFVTFLCYTIISERELTNGTLWKISIIVLIICCIIGVCWFLVFRKVRIEDKKMILVAFYISFREFLFSTVLFFAGDLLLGAIASILPAFSVVMLISLMFAYPVIRVTMTKPVLAKIYNVK